MINQFTVVGRLVNNPTEIENLENTNIEIEIEVSIPRPYKNLNGEYENDVIVCKVWNGIAKTIAENCKKNDVVGVQGRILNNNKLLADKITFLNTKIREEK